MTLPTQSRTPLNSSSTLDALPIWPGVLLCVGVSAVALGIEHVDDIKYDLEQALNAI